MESPLRAHFVARAAQLRDVASLESELWAGTETLILQPRAQGALAVELDLLYRDGGTVSFSDPASTLAELGEDLANDLAAIDAFIEDAVEGRVTTYLHPRGRGGVTEVVTDGQVARYWSNAFGFPGWRRRYLRTAYGPYRIS